MWQRYHTSVQWFHNRGNWVPENGNFLYNLLNYSLNLKLVLKSLKDRFELSLITLYLLPVSNQESLESKWSCPQLPPRFLPTLFPGLLLPLVPPVPSHQTPSPFPDLFYFIIFFPALLGRLTQRHKQDKGRTLGARDWVGVQLPQRKG